MRIFTKPSPLTGSFILSLVMILCLQFSTGCSSKKAVVYIPKKKTPTTTQTQKAPAQKTPPGQAKKAAGAQSAKEFAPGQQKKKKN